MSQPAKAWTLADAKAHLSEVVESALKKGPQVITRHGRKAVVVVAAEEWERKTGRQGPLADFFCGLAIGGPRSGDRRSSGRPPRLPPSTRRRTATPAGNIQAGRPGWD